MSIKKRIEQLEDMFGAKKEKGDYIHVLSKHHARKDRVAFIRDGEIFEDVMLLARHRSESINLSEEGIKKYQTEEGAKKLLEIGYRIISFDSDEYKQWKREDELKK